MKYHDRQLLRASAELLDWLEARASEQPRITLPTDIWQLAERRARQQRVAALRGWELAQQQVTRHARHEIESLRNRLRIQVEQLDQAAIRSEWPTTSEIFRDLKALQKEFPKLRCDLQSHQLVVTTEPIAIDGFDLGAFDILLFWDSHLVSPPYQVIAKTPHPDWAADGITHPHVQNDELCEGEGGEAIEKALAAGRFYDLFLLVSRVLNTYAPDGAYRRLDEDSNLTTCGDCGDSISQDDCSGCPCGESLCDACSRTCSFCESTLCFECNSPCKFCEATCCDYCIVTCPECNQGLCSDCLTKNGCAQCNKEPPDERECAAEQVANPSPVEQHETRAA